MARGEGGHRGLEEVAAGDGPLVVLISEHSTDQVDLGGVVGKILTTLERHLGASPIWLVVLAIGDLHETASIGVHDVDALGRTIRSCEHDPVAVGRPTR